MSRDDYKEIGCIGDRDGVHARITKRTNPRGFDQVSFQVFRTYSFNGETRETTWFSGRHLPAISRLLTEVDERLRLERERIACRNS